MKKFRQFRAVGIGLACVLACAPVTQVQALPSGPYSQAAAVPSISFLEQIQKIYDGNPVADPSVSNSSDGAVVYTYYKGNSASGTPLSSRPIEADTYTVVASTPATDHFTSASVSQTFTIAKRSVKLGLSFQRNNDVLTVTAVVENAVDDAVEDGTIHFSIDSYSGTQPTASITKSGGMYQASADFDETKMSAATLEVTAAYSGSSDYQDRTDTISGISKAVETRTITMPNTVIEKDYGDTVASLGTPIVSDTKYKDIYSYEVDDDEYGAVDSSMQSSVSVDYASGAVSIRAAGTSYLKVTVSETNGQFQNACTYVKVTVRPAVLQVQVSALIRGTENTSSYGDLTGIVYGLTYSGFKYSDDKSTYTNGRGSLQAVKLSTAAGAGTYSIGIQHVGSTNFHNYFLSRNYTFTCVPASFTVTPRTLGLASIDATGIWGTEPSYPAPSITNLASFDCADTVFTTAPATILSGSSYNSLAPGIYTDVLTPSAVLKDSMKNNYILRLTKADLTVQKASTALSIQGNSQTYNGKPVSIQLKYDSRVEVTPIISYYKTNSNIALTEAPSEPGQYRAVASITGSQCFKDVTSQEISFTITKIDPVYTVEDLSKIYDGKAVTPAVSSSAGSNCTYQIQYTNTDTNKVLLDAPSTAGNYSMTIFSAANDHYNAAEYTKNFTISKKVSAPAIPEIKNISRHVGMTLSEVVLPEGWTWDDPSIVLTAGMMQATATYTPEDLVNETRFTTPLTFTVLGESDAAYSSAATGAGVGILWDTSFFLLAIGTCLCAWILRRSAEK